MGREDTLFAYRIARPINTNEQTKTPVDYFDNQRPLFHCYHHPLMLPVIEMHSPAFTTNAKRSVPLVAGTISHWTKAATKQHNFFNTVPPLMWRAFLTSAAVSA
jgi:hypothetical protein